MRRSPAGDAGAQEHLAKPVNVHSLIAAISHVLEREAGEPAAEDQPRAAARS